MTLPAIQLGLVRTPEPTLTAIDSFINTRVPPFLLTQQQIIVDGDYAIKFHIKTPSTVLEQRKNNMT
jgi:hypothetical protein